MILNLLLFYLHAKTERDSNITDHYRVSEYETCTHSKAVVLASELCESESVI